jgi:hypothetical protein
MTPLLLDIVNGWVKDTVTYVSVNFQAVVKLVAVARFALCYFQSALDIGQLTCSGPLDDLYFHVFLLSDISHYILLLSCIKKPGKRYN